MKKIIYLFAIFLINLTSPRGLCASIANDTSHGVKYTFRAPYVNLTLYTYNNVHFSSSIKNLCNEKIQIPDHCTFLDLGTGNGAYALWAVKNKNCSKSVGTDILPEAIENAKFNAAELGVERRAQFRLVNLKNPGAYSVIGENERFDVIFSNPPFFSMPAEGLHERSYADPGYEFTKSIVIDYRKHLKKHGHLYLLQGRREGIANIFNLIKKNNLSGKVICPAEFNSFEEMTSKLGNNFQNISVMFELN